jgi:hypothetical protein
MIPDGIIGGLVGLFGGIGNGIMDIFKHKRETERMKAQWAHEEVMFAKTADHEIERGAADAFKASVASDSIGGDWPTFPAGTPAWIIMPAVLTEAVRKLTRPALTWCLVIQANGNPNMADAAGLAVGWWFGSRTTARFQSK